MSYLLSSRKHGRKGLRVKIPTYPCTVVKRDGQVEVIKEKKIRLYAGCYYKCAGR